MASENGQAAQTLKRYVSQRKKRGPARARMQPPLTPMIDVTFQLLIFFLLTASFRVEALIPGTLPPVEGQSAVVDFKPIRVKLIPAGPFGMEVVYEVTGVGQIQSHQRLYRYFRQKRQRFPRPKSEEDDVPVVIAPEPRVRWQHVVEVFNQAVRAEFVNIGFTPAGA